MACALVLTSLQHRHDVRRNMQKNRHLLCFQQVDPLLQRIDLNDPRQFTDRFDMRDMVDKAVDFQTVVLLVNRQVEKKAAARKKHRHDHTDK